VENASVDVSVVGDPAADERSDANTSETATIGGGVSFAGTAAILTVITTLATGFVLVRRRWGLPDRP
jgi:hypothetical protein